MKSLLSAIRTLTVLPLPGTEKQSGVTLYWFPLVGLFFGLIGFVMAAGLDRVPSWQWNEGTAFFVLLAVTVLSGGLHLDGLADWADGFLGIVDPSETLKAMTDPRPGVFGVVAVALVLGGKYLAIKQIITAGHPIFLLPVFLLPRCGQVVLVSLWDYARKEGTAGPFIQHGSKAAALFSVVSGGVICMILLGRTGVFLTILMLLIVFAIGFWSRKRIDGITGDVIGAGSEFAELLLLITGAVMTQWPDVFVIYDGYDYFLH